MSYLIGGEVFTLQDIENGVLRGNRKGVAQLRRPFSRTDPRLQVSHRSVDPQITVSPTFPQNQQRCRSPSRPLGGAAGRRASHSFCTELRGKGLPTNQNLHTTGKQDSPCHTQGLSDEYAPAVLNVLPQDIDSQLQTAAEAFLENDDACMVDSGKKEVRLSQIFKWYKADFGGTDEKVSAGIVDLFNARQHRDSTLTALSPDLSAPIFFVVVVVAGLGCGAHGRLSEEDQPAGGPFCWED